MKQSRYVVGATGAGGEHLLYNVENGAFVQLGETAYAAWKNDACTGELADALAARGLLTERSPEEQLDIQQRLFARERAQTESLELSIVPTYACNYRCPYCYELGHNKIKGKMDERTADAIMAFAQFQLERMGFSRMRVQWYGGDPSLALDEVAELSRRLIAWSEEHGISYSATMLTNANVIGEKEAKTIADCRISSVYLTIDGPEELHNKRRIAANGSNSYERTIEAARHLRANGIALTAAMNTDKVNALRYEELRRKLLEEEGISLSMVKLNDYGHFYGEAPFCAPDFDLFTHEDFFRAQFEEFAKYAHTAGELRDMLRPIRRFCTGQLDNYYIIDLLGDVYKCDGRVGEAPYVLFNLFEDQETWKFNEITFDATHDAKCSACELLPVCQGSCFWERSCSGMPCHPFKTTIGDYLRLYRELIGDVPEQIPGVIVLAEPYTPAELGWNELADSRDTTSPSVVGNPGENGRLA